MQKLKTKVENVILQAKKWMTVEFDQRFGLDYNLGKLMGASGNLSYP